MQRMDSAKSSIAKKAVQQGPWAGTMLPCLTLLLVFAHEVSAQLANVSLLYVYISYIFVYGPQALPHTGSKVSKHIVLPFF